jgi:hypothetical protein
MWADLNVARKEDSNPNAIDLQIFTFFFQNSAPEFELKNPLPERVIIK